MDDEIDSCDFTAYSELEHLETTQDHLNLITLSLNTIPNMTQAHIDSIKINVSSVLLLFKRQFNQREVNQTWHSHLQFFRTIQSQYNSLLLKLQKKQKALSRINSIQLSNIELIKIKELQNKCQKYQKVKRLAVQLTDEIFLCISQLQDIADQFKMTDFQDFLIRNRQQSHEFWHIFFTILVRCQRKIQKAMQGIDLNE